MKKTIIVVLLVLSISMFSVFALDGVSFYAGVGYDFRDTDSLGNNSHSMEFEVGSKYAIGGGFNIYGDLGIRFVGEGSVEGEAIKDGFLGTNAHFGLVYGMRFVNCPEIETYIGGGISYATTMNSSRYFNNLGVGLKFAIAYRFKDNFALAISDHTDVYFINSTIPCVGWGDSVSLGAMFKF